MKRALHWVQDLACCWSADCSSNAEVLPESQVGVFVDWLGEQFPRIYQPWLESHRARPFGQCRIRKIAGRKRGEVFNGVFRSGIRP
jgi:hypothetical protein